MPGPATSGNAWLHRSRSAPCASPRSTLCPSPSPPACSSCCSAAWGRHGGWGARSSWRGTSLGESCRLWNGRRPGARSPARRPRTPGVTGRRCGRVVTGLRIGTPHGSLPEGLFLRYGRFLRERRSMRESRDIKESPVLRERRGVRERRPGPEPPPGDQPVHDDRCPEADHEQQRRSEEHTSELQSRRELVCRLLLEKKKTE